MNGMAQNNRNSLLHREVRYGANAHFDGIHIGVDLTKPQKRFLREVPLGPLRANTLPSLRLITVGEKTLEALAANIRDASDRVTLAGYYHFLVSEVE